MTTKPTARITDYIVVRDANKKPLYLLGEVSRTEEDPELEKDGNYWQSEFIKTSPIINLDEKLGTCETENTMYTLDGEAISSSDVCAIFPY